MPVCSYTDYNRICWNNNHFLSPLLFPCHYYNFFSNCSQIKICRSNIVILTKSFFFLREELAARSSHSYRFLRSYLSLLVFYLPLQNDSGSRHSRRTKSESTSRWHKTDVLSGTRLDGSQMGRYRKSEPDTRHQTNADDIPRGN